MSVSVKNLIFSIFIICLLTIISVSFPECAVARDESLLGINISATSAIVIDEETGEALFEKSPNVHLPPASTTKIMTGILVLENSKLDDIVKITVNAGEIGESSIYLTDRKSVV